MRVRTALLSIGLLTAMVALGAPSRAQGTEPGPGAPGVGDPYFPLDGNGGYDVGHYDLDVTYDPASDVLTGIATITATATQGLSRFNLDFVGLDIHQITVDGDAATWTRDASELIITPAQPLAETEEFVVVASYDGVPPPIDEPGLGTTEVFVHTSDGALAVGQPHAAAAWFPVNDHPMDPASYTFRITVPEGLEAVANGHLQDRTAAGGPTTWIWEAREPMASYLTTIAIGEFEIREYEEGGIAYLDAIDPVLDLPPDRLGRVAWEALARQPEIIDFLSGYLGPYPFTAAGGIVDDADLGFALETQTRPVYDPRFFADPASGASVVVHELTHQWYGNSVLLEAWPHIWLNEGFATYMEWLWSEREGAETAQEWFDAVVAIPADEPFWSVPIGDPGPEELFAPGVYFRGAATLHALRLEIGDDAFFRLLERWILTQAGEHVTIPEFVAFAEDLTGRQLDDFFATWLFTPEKPAGLSPADVAAPTPAMVGHASGEPVSG